MGNMKITDKQFLQGIFGKDFNNVHVTDFTYDPLKIPAGEGGKSWFGNLFKTYKFKNQMANRYFCISKFSKDEKGVPRRKKSLFIKTYVVVLDDVKEKLPIDQVSRLVKPSYILETSQGSEQWGYILNKPCEDRFIVENLLDGLVSKGLSPDGKDPGMKGVTRYVRLPNGFNMKESKFVNGIPFRCRLLKWSPFETVKVEELAEPLGIDLHQIRREVRIDGASNVPDHPFLHCGLNIKEKRSNGRFDITCPWVDEHTNASDDGSAIFTNEDGSPGFKCHHGSCQSRTAKDLIRYIENKNKGFTERYDNWKFNHVFKDVIGDLANNNPNPKDKIIEQLENEDNKTKMYRDKIAEFLKIIEDSPEIEKNHYHSEVCRITGWSKTEFNKILNDLRGKWYWSKSQEFYESIIFIREQNVFYDYKTEIFYKVDAFQNSFIDKDVNVKKEALVSGRVTKVDKMDFRPKEERIFEKDGIVYANSWVNKGEDKGVRGDCSDWLNHWDVIGWGDNKKHMLQWMAYTILHPKNKINHILLLGGKEGIGKDFLIYPLISAMKDYQTTIDGHELAIIYSEYLLNTKYLHINEIELADHKQAVDISNKLKPIAASPPETLRVGQKHIKPMNIQNIVNVTMATNSQTPIKLNGTSRRFYAVWSDLNTRDENDNPLPKWVSYWNQKWDWMKNKGGLDHCIWYLRNCVDLSDFNPGEAPEMTEFLRDITESSKSVYVQTVESFIDNGLGKFKYDLVTSSEACSTLKSRIIDFEDYMYAKPEWFTPTKVGRVMSEISSCKKLRARKKDSDLRLWAVRNKDKYEKMTPIELYETYENQKVNRNVSFISV